MVACVDADAVMSKRALNVGILFVGKAAAGGIPETIPEVDSPRTYRTETHGKPGKGKRGGQEEDLESALITPAETREMLSKTFNYFRRALVRCIV